MYPPKTFIFYNHKLFDNQTSKFTPCNGSSSSIMSKVKLDSSKSPETRSLTFIITIAEVLI